MEIHAWQNISYVWHATVRHAAPGRQRNPRRGGLGDRRRQVRQRRHDRRLPDDVQPLLPPGADVPTTEETTLIADLNKVLNKYGLETYEVGKMYDSKELSRPSNQVPIREMELHMNCILPPEFIGVLVMFNVRSLRSQ